jgi:hypothetical protein
MSEDHEPWVEKLLNGPSDIARTHPVLPIPPIQIASGGLMDEHHVDR